MKFAYHVFKDYTAKLLTAVSCSPYKESSSQQNEECICKTLILSSSFFSAECELKRCSIPTAMCMGKANNPEDLLE